MELPRDSQSLEKGIETIDAALRLLAERIARLQSARHVDGFSVIDTLVHVEDLEATLLRVAQLKHIRFFIQKQLRSVAAGDRQALQLQS